MNFFAQVQAAAPSAESWYQYAFDRLPAFFQQPAMAFLIVVSVAIYGQSQKIPKASAHPQISEGITTVLAIALAVGLHIGGDVFYAIGSGVLSAWGASSFYSWGLYDMFAMAIKAIARKVTGQPSPSTPSEPLEPDPTNPPPNQKP